MIRIDTHAYREGHAAGMALLKPGPGIRALVAARAHRAAVDGARHDERDRDRVIAVEWAAAALRAAETAREAARDRASRLRAERDANPGAFSKGRARVYLAAAFLVLLADFTFLAQVLSLVLNVPGVVRLGQGQAGILGVLLNGRVDLLPQIGDLLLSTLGVVALGVAFKAWADRRSRTRDEATARRTERVLMRSDSVIAVLVLATIVGIALSRFFVDVGAHAAATQTPEAAMAGRVVAVLVGIACPLAGALMLMRGLDLRSAAGLLARAEREERAAEAPVAAARERLERATQEAGAGRDERLAATGPDAVLLDVNDYRRGYADGVAALLAGPPAGSVYRRLRVRLAGAAVADVDGVPTAHLLPPAPDA